MADPLWVRLLGLALPRAYRREILDDLLDERAAMVRRGCTPARGARWLLGHVLLSVGASWYARSPFAGAPAPAGGPRHRRSLFVGREIRQAARSLRRTPWYAATIVGVIALSMALATTVFAIVDGVLFRPLPYPNPGELYAVGGVFDADVEPSDRGIELLSEKEFTAWSADAPGVVMTGLAYTSLQLPDGQGVRAVGIERRFFDVFGVRLRLGSFDDMSWAPTTQSGSSRPPVPVIISHEVWIQHFDGDAGVMDRVVRPPGFLAMPYQVVGVLEPEGFVPPLRSSFAANLESQTRIEMLVPWLNGPDFPERGMVVFARIPEGQLANVAAALDRAAAAYAATVPPLAANLSPAQRRARAAYTGVELQPLRGYLTSRERPMFALMFGTVIALVALVLLNAGALAAARAAGRGRETSLRLALGARPRDLLRHAMAEQLVLAIPAAAVGLALCPLLLAAATDLMPPGLTLIKEAQVDWRVAAFTALVVCATSFLVALFPVRVASQGGRFAHANVDLKGRAPVRGGLGRVLVTGQVALAFVLILGGAFFVTSLARVLNEEPGFRTRDAVIVLVKVRHMQVPRDRGPELAAAVRRLPGVSNAALFSAPVLRPLFETSQFRLPGAERPPDDGPASFEIGAGFFEASGIRLLEGRLPSDAELDAQLPVLAVSDTVARAFWPSQSAVGQTLLSWRRVPFTVVGVVADVRWAAPDFEPDGAIYSTWAEGRTFLTSLQLYVTLERDTRASDLSAAVARMQERSPDFWGLEVRSVEDALVETIRTRRLSALMASVFGGVALLIVAVGLLGLVGMTASRRTREVGIRMALGAPRAGVVRQLVGEQLVAVTAGILAGAVLATWVVSLIQAQLYETAPADPLVWLTSVVVMLAVATLGALAPAVRASRVDPVEALRQD